MLLLVDQRLGMFFGSRGSMKSVVAAQTAALAAWRVTSLGDRVGAIVFSEGGMEEIRPRARDAAVAPILNAIVRQNRALRADDPRPSDPGLINEALRKALRLMLHDGLVTLITDAAGANAETVKLVTELTAHNDVLTVFIHDPLEAELPDLGRAVVAEAVRQMDIDMSAGALRTRFAASFAERREAIERFSRRRTIPVLPLSTERDTAEQLRELLGRRRARTLAGAA
ncbi:MAG: MoxR protein [Microvirga sp.]|nr:MoxR protein [Microvirga sp.]